MLVGYFTREAGGGGAPTARNKIVPLVCVTRRTKTLDSDSVRLLKKKKEKEQMARVPISRTMVK